MSIQDQFCAVLEISVLLAIDKAQLNNMLNCTKKRKACKKRERCVIIQK